MLFLPVLLAALVGSAVVAGAVYAVVQVIRRPGHPVALFVLLWWAVLFLVVTQFPTNKGGTEHLNLMPFQAFEPGDRNLTNAGTPTQFVLNILLTVPLGLLLPVVARWRLLPVAATGLAVALATETVQFFTGRHADIDDVIANTAGVLVGFAIFAVVRAGRAQPSAAAPAE